MNRGFDITVNFRHRFRSLADTAKYLDVDTFPLMERAWKTLARKQKYFIFQGKIVRIVKREE